MKNYVKYVICFTVLSFVLIACNNASSFKTLAGENITLDSKLCTYIFLNAECPICQKYQGSFKSMKFPNSQVYYVFPGDQSKDLIQDMCVYDSINLNHVILDLDYRLTKQLKANVTPEAIIKKDNEIYYKGMIDDRFSSIGSSKPFSSINYVENALNSLLKNEAVKIPYTKAVGCFIEHK